MEYDSHLPTEGLLTAVCSATGRPAPKITWLDDRDLDESPEIHQIQNANGTVTVATRLTFSANRLHALACLLDHPQGRKMKAVYLEKGREGRLRLYGDVQHVVGSTWERMCNCGSVACTYIGLVRHFLGVQTSC